MKNLAEFADRGNTRNPKGFFVRVAIVLALLMTSVAIGAFFLFRQFGQSEYIHTEDIQEEPITENKDFHEKYGIPKQDFPLTVTLEPGRYIVGKDIPAGVYHFAATAGKGYVSSSRHRLDGGIQTGMSAEKAYNYVSSYRNVSLLENDTLHVDSVVLEINSDYYVAESIRREADTTETYTLSEGTYTVGNEIKPGTYNLLIKGEEGNFKLDTSRDYLFGYFYKEDSSRSSLFRSYRNIPLSRADELVIEGENFALTLTPSTFEFSFPQAEESK